MTAEEYLDKVRINEIPYNIIMFKPIEVIQMLQDFARLKCEEQKEKDKFFILPLCKKFIDKVDTGRARSKETYKDMKDIVNYLNSPEPEI